MEDPETGVDLQGMLSRISAIQDVRKCEEKKRVIKQYGSMGMFGNSS